MKTHEEGKDLHSIPWQLECRQLNRQEDSLQALIRTSSSYKACSGPFLALGWPLCCGYTNSGFESIPLTYDIVGGTR